MNEQEAKIDDFLNIVLRNLEKNGFPEKAVSFSLDKMFESASKRGFSFNKIRDRLQERDIATELTNEHVIFRSPATPDPKLDFSDMAAAAQEIFQQLDPEQRSQLEKVMREMKPDDLNAIRQQWESMPDDEKVQIMQEMHKPRPE